MTDQQFQPAQDQTQTTTPVQGGGVFGGGENIFADTSMFATIPTAPQEESFTLPHDDFEISVPAAPEVAIPEVVIPEPVNEVLPVVEAIPTPISEPTISKPEIEAPIVEPVVIEKVPAAPIVESPVPESTPVVEATPAIEPTPIVEKPAVVEPVSTVETPVQAGSDIRKKFDEMVANISLIMKSLHLGAEDLIDIIGADNDKLTTLYQFGINDTKDVIIKKIETEKETEESSFNELRFGIDPESNSVQVVLDDILLYDEEELLADNKKKSQVMDKLNKFVFLTGEQRKDIEKEAKAKEEEERERRRLQDIFRNF